MSHRPLLRPYQSEAIAAVLQARRQGCQRMVVCLPTGAGKTVIFSELARMARQPVLVLAHREELLQQAQAKLQAALGDSRQVGIEQADRSASADASVVVASLRSLHDQRLERVMQQRQFGLILYDECHHAVAEDNRRVLRQLGCFDRDWQGTLLGLTATAHRADGLPLGDVFDRIVYHRALPDLIEQGWLVPLRGFRIATTADLSGLSSGGMDFREEELAQAVDIEERNALVARSIQELARDRRTVAFCVTVGHARNLAKALRHLGVRASIVHGEMASVDRADVLQRFRDGAIEVLANVGVLTEGFDDPGVSCIAMARPTRSDGLYAQCVGRGTRLFDGKKDCLVLDFVDLSALSLMTLPTLFGLPPMMDLRGEDAGEAGKVWQRIQLDMPGFELEAGAITLGEIQQRAAHFDPLTLRVDAEVRAISPLAWESLGSRGLALHFLTGSKALSEVLVLNQGGRGKRWLVLWDDKPKARFSSLEEAVQAVDWEVEQRGAQTLRSAMTDARWRDQPIGAALATEMQQVRTQGQARNRGEALKLLAFAQAHTRTAEVAARAAVAAPDKS